MYCFILTSHLIPSFDEIDPFTAPIWGLYLITLMTCEEHQVENFQHIWKA
jgi:hypothetical protein